MRATYYASTQEACEHVLKEVLNTNRLVDKTWFNVLLWCGIVGIVLGPLFGLGALFWWGLMIAYLVGGPDGMAVQQPQIATLVAPPKTLAPTG